MNLLGALVPYFAERAGRAVFRRMRGKVAMVAGASKGLGFGIARALAREGALVSIGARTESGVFDAAEALAEETGAEVLANVLDAASPDSISQWVENTAETFGALRCWWSMPATRPREPSTISTTRSGRRPLN